MIHILSTLRGSTEFVQARAASSGTPPGPDPDSTCPVRPGERALVALKDGIPLARAVAQPLIGRPGVGNIALFESVDDFALSNALLAACEAHLAKIGCRIAVGPMDGDTWHAYRTADPGGEAPFLLDRSTPAWTGSLFRSAGYEVCDRYLSTWIPRDDLAWPRLETHLKRFGNRGVTFRPLRIDDWDRELAHLHRLSLEAFADNSWATGLDLEGFRALYDPWRGRLPTEGILLAFQADRLLAYVVSCPQTLPDGLARTIIKTVAASRERSAQGLGALLVESVHRMAHQDGHSGVIHALMHERNPSTHILSRAGTVLRTYSLWKKDLP